LGVIPAPPPSGASPRSFPGQGPVSPHLFQQGPIWGTAGAGGRGRERYKNTPRPGPFSGAGWGIGLGAPVFRGPGGPVMNTTSSAVFWARGRHGT